MLETMRCMVSARSRAAVEGSSRDPRLFYCPGWMAYEYCTTPPASITKSIPHPAWGLTGKPVVSTAKRLIAREAGNSRNDNPAFYICLSPQREPYSRQSCISAA